MLRLPAALLSLCATLFAAVPMALPSGIERLPNGNTLIADANAGSGPTCRAVEVDSLGRLVWAYLGSDVPWLHTARRLANGNTLMTATNGDRVLEVNPAGDSVWAMSAGLDYPNEAHRLANGNTLITDRDHSRVIEVNSAGTIVWSYTALDHPHNGSRLPNGNTLICDSDANRVVEVSPAGTVVWQCAPGFRWPRSAQRLANGRTLIADSRNNRVVEVDSAGAIRWVYDQSIPLPYMALRLPNGRTLISAGTRVVEIAGDSGEVWQYPPRNVVAVDTIRVFNPSSGCSLYVHIHRPNWAGSGRRVPGVVLVPAEGGLGTGFDTDGTADNIASDGFAVLHFDPDGRGRSGSYPANYAGHVNQDGVNRCARRLAEHNCVDTACVGIYAQSWGITMASGAIARHPDTPRVAFLLDFEGPSDRRQTCSDSGGYIPVPADSEAFWQEREAARFMKAVPAAYLRIQTRTDHNSRITDNRHCIALADSATATAHGGSGISAWTRVNDSVMNPPNRTYTLGTPPAWIPETQEVQKLPRVLLYLHELTRQDFPTALTEPGAGYPKAATNLRVVPNPAFGSAFVLGIPAGYAGPQSVRILDASGRTVRTFRVPGGRPAFRLSLAGIRPGVYFLELQQATARFVIAGHSP